MKNWRWMYYNCFMMINRFLTESASSQCQCLTEDKYSLMFHALYSIHCTKLYNHLPQTGKPPSPTHIKAYPFVYHPCHWLAFELAHSLWFEMGVTGAQAKDSSTVHIPSQTSFWVLSIILYYSAPQLHSNLFYPHCQYEPIYPCTFLYHHNINTQSITVFISKFLQHWELLINCTHTMGKCFA